MSNIQEQGGGYFQCDQCGYWGLCVKDLSGLPHTVKRHVSPTDLEQMIAHNELPPKEDIGKLRERAREGRLAVIRTCGTFQRVTFDSLQKRGFLKASQG